MIFHIDNVADSRYGWSSSLSYYEIPQIAHGDLIYLTEGGIDMSAFVNTIIDRAVNQKPWNFLHR